jgi:hypothetical protein
VRTFYCILGVILGSFRRFGGFCPSYGLPSNRRPILTAEGAELIIAFQYQFLCFLLLKLKAASNFYRYINLSYHFEVALNLFMR